MHNPHLSRKNKQIKQTTLSVETKEDETKRYTLLRVITTYKIRRQPISETFEESYCRCILSLDIIYTITRKIYIFLKRPFIPK